MNQHETVLPTRNPEHGFYATAPEEWNGSSECAEADADIALATLSSLMD